MNVQTHKITPKVCAGGGHLPRDRACDASSRHGCTATPVPGQACRLPEIQVSWHGRTKLWKHIANLTALGSWYGGIRQRCEVRGAGPRAGSPRYSFDGAVPAQQDYPTMLGVRFSARAA
jgi:hypothetical protein